jgi:hypothetical protein
LVPHGSINEGHITGSGIVMDFAGGSRFPTILISCRLSTIPKGETSTFKGINCFGSRPSVNGQRDNDRAIHLSGPVHML